MTARRATTTWAIGGPLGGVGAAVLIISGLAFFGEWWWVLDIVANFRMQLVVTGLGILLGGVALRTGGVAVIGLAVVAVNAVPIVPLYVGGGSAAESDLRIATYNLRLGAIEDASAVVDWLEEVEADVVFLQEAGPVWTRIIEQSDVALELIEPDLRPHEPFGTMALVPPGARVRFVDVIERSAPAVAIEVNDVTVTILGVHARSPYGGGPSERRDAELVSIGEWASDQGGAVVVAGDFNATPFVWSFRRMLEIGGLHNSQKGFGMQTSWPTTNLLMRIPIDHVVYAGDMTVVDRRVHGPLGSDHLPVVVDLAIGG